MSTYSMRAIAGLLAIVATFIGPAAVFAETGYGGGGGGGGGNGPIVGSLFGGSIIPGGSVLGTSTNAIVGGTPTTCGPIITTYMRRGFANNAAQVRVLQTFLNKELGLSIPVTGVYGPQTENAVKAFQKKHMGQTLTPWGLTEPTGFVYRSTQRWINLVHCSSLNIPMPALQSFSGR